MTIGAALVLAAISCTKPNETAAPAAEPVQAGSPIDAGTETQPEPVAASFREVSLHLTDSVVLEVRYLEGALAPRPPHRMPVFDDQKSFTLEIDSAELSLSPDSLTHLLNEHVFAYEDAPLTDLNVSIEEGALKQTGKLHKGIVLPFTILADVSATCAGQIRLHPTSIKVAGIPSGRLLKLLGIELADLIDSERARGFQVAGNDLLVSPNQLLPEPRIDGRLTAIRIEKGRIVQQFGSAREAPSDSTEGPHHMYYRGGTLRFGKLTMSDADMELIDADPSDPFDFFPARYIDQLVAGYSKNTRTGGLKVYMPDFGDLSRIKAGQASSPRGALHPR